MRKLYTTLLVMTFCMAKVNARDFKPLQEEQGKGGSFESEVSIPTNSDKSKYAASSVISARNFNPYEEEIEEDNYDYVNEINPQGLELTWANQVKGSGSNLGKSVTTDLEDNTYIVGEFEDFTDFNRTEIGGVLKTENEFSDIYVQKRDSNGKHVWAKQIRGTATRKVGRVITDCGNNVYVIGTFEGKADFDLGEGEKWLTAKGASDIFILKLDAEGNTVWVEQISTGGSISEETAGTGSMQIGTDNNLYVTGFFKDSLSATIGGQSINFNSESESIFALKMDLDGGFEWVKNFEGNGKSYTSALSLDQDNNVYISGDFTGAIEFDPNGEGCLLEGVNARDKSMFVTKLDTNGVLEWVKKIDNATIGGGISVTNDARNNVYISGIFCQVIDANPNKGLYKLTPLSEEGANTFMVKLTSEGTFLWATPTQSNDYSELHGIVVDKEGYSYGIGSFSGAIKFGEEGCEEISSCNKESQIFIQKISPIGTLEWVKGIGAEGADEGLGLHIDDDYNLYATGSFEGEVNFNVNTIEKNLTSGGAEDTFVLKMSIVGDGWFCEEDQEEEVYNLEYVWGKQLKGDSNNEGESITTDCDGNVYVTGSFKGITDFDTYLDGKRLTNGYKEASDIYIQKLTPEGYHVWAKQIMGSSTQQVSRIVADADNNLYVLGTFEGTADFDLGEERLWMTAKYGTDVFVLKLDSDGNTIWAKQIGTGGVPDKGFMQLGKDNHLYVTSSFTGQLTTEVRGSAVQIASEGESLFALKMSLDGEFKWVKHFEGVASGYGTTEALSLDQDNNVYVAGHFGRAMDFDPSEASHILRTESRGATFITKLDKEGTFSGQKCLRMNS
ncbi:hypothetical protein [Tenacibaculum maritimum]|uniref:hypothetical protein n=1 Tax=Tenacibaculum maritimum TaxID=107401 RepID=UPI003890CC93